MGTSDGGTFLASLGHDPMTSRSAPEGSVLPQGYPLWCAVRRPGVAKPVAGHVVAWITRGQGTSRADPVVAFPPHGNRTHSSVTVVDLDLSKAYFADSRADALAAAGG